MATACLASLLSPAFYLYQVTRFSPILANSTRGGFKISGEVHVPRLPAGLRC